jgi:esterase/lipase superfamily enzyme
MNKPPYRFKTVSAITAACALFITGCSSGPVMPTTPNLYTQTNAAAFDNMPPDRQTTDIDILYATDRKPIEISDKDLKYYDERRSNSLVFGHVNIQLGQDQSWEDVLRESLDPDGQPIPLEITQVEELVRFPSSIALPVRIDGELTDDPEVLAAREAADQVVRDELSRRLATSTKKDVYIYVHGVGNSFDDPMYRMAELWHFMGRPGVPIVYTWPAVKGGGPLRGYTYARESSEFTTYHLRRFIQTVASSPDVERIHILAHSRGTGVTLSVLNSLRLIYKNDAPAARKELKLGNVILAAPDIDLQVAQQLFRPDQVHQIMDRFTMYATPEDKALGIAEFLFSSLTRLGAVTKDNLSPAQAKALKENRLGIDVINVNTKDKGSHGHTYWIDNPSVLSDIILILRDNLSPGTEHGRPLLQADSGIWQIYDGYPFAGPHADRQNPIRYQADNN